MTLSYLRAGEGRPLLLVHGLGSNARSWSPVWQALAAQRDVIAVDLPGFGGTPPLAGKPSVQALADALVGFIEAHGLRGVDAVGSSMGGRLVLELARRGGSVGAVVALAPGGNWLGWERHTFYGTVWTSVRMVRALQPWVPAIVANPFTRSLLLAQLTRRARELDTDTVLQEVRSYAQAPAFDGLLREVAYGPPQEGAPAGRIRTPLVIGWGRSDRICPPRQAKRALALFPDARLHWFERCGHFPHWDAPEETVRLILETTSVPAAAAAAPVPAVAPTVSVARA